MRNMTNYYYNNYQYLELVNIFRKGIFGFHTTFSYFLPFSLDPNRGGFPKTTTLFKINMYFGFLYIYIYMCICVLLTIQSKLHKIKLHNFFFLTIKLHKLNILA